MSTFTLAISFDHFQFALIHGPDIPGSYAIFSLQHWTLLLPPVTSTSGYCFCFGAIPSLWSYFSTDIQYRVEHLLTWGVPLLVSYHFSLFILFMGFSKQEYWSGLPFPSPVDHILSDLSIMTRLSWVSLQAWLGFIELDKAVFLVWLDWLVFCEYGFSVSALWWPLATPTILLGFLLPWHEVSLEGYIINWLNRWYS